MVDALVCGIYIFHYFVKISTWCYSISCVVGYKFSSLDKLVDGNVSIMFIRLDFRWLVGFEKNEID